jgi:exonuclease VII small subunit
MPSDEKETKAFMTAYSGLKAAAKALETMSHETEPDLDKMLMEVKRAKQFYDQCNEVIENIKSQVDSIFSGSVAAGNDDFAEPIGGRAESAEGQQAAAEIATRRRAASSDTDDEIPF